MRSTAPAMVRETAAPSDSDCPLPADGTVHLWQVAVPAPSPVAERLWLVLCGDERARALRYRHPAVRARYIAARGALRHILAGYLGQSPAALSFAYDCGGKPRLHNAINTADLRFNLTHAGPLAVCAVSVGREVGVDAEPASRTAAVIEAAGRFLSPLERGQLHSLPVAERGVALLRCWVRKEAYLKGRGLGIGYPLEALSVRLSSAGGSLCPIDRHDKPGGARWRLVDLELGPSYVGALALEGAAPLPCPRRWCIPVP